MNPMITHGLATERHLALRGLTPRPAPAPLGRGHAAAPLRRRVGMLLLTAGLHLLTHERARPRRSPAPLAS